MKKKKKEKEDFQNTEEKTAVYLVRNTGYRKLGM